jgi:hypothetical protein
MIASTHHHAQDNMQSNLLLIELLVVDAKTATGQEKSQINSKLHAFQDHLLFAMIAPPDNHPTDTAANNAQQDKFKIHKT